MTDARKVQLFVPTYRIEETLAEIRDCLERGWTGLGFKTDVFEKSWREYTGLPNAHFLNSATAGLHLAVELLKESRGWMNGEEIITTPITFVLTNHAIRYADLKPVFADVDVSLNLSPASVSEKITDRTRAVMFVGMGGNHANLNDVAKLCRERGLALILDAAHMAGSRIGDEHVGRQADVTVFSFQAVKNLPTADAGMVCFADAALDAEARKRSWLGISKNTFARTEQKGSYRWEYDIDNIGYKYNGNSVMAAMAIVALRHLDQDNAYRRQIAEWYDTALRGCVHVTLVPHERGSSRHLYQVAVRERDALMVFLNTNEIYPGVHYKDNRAYPMYAEADPVATCPVAWNTSEAIISLPIHMRLSHDDVQHVARKVRAFYERP